ncbi:hypothetical protein BJ508DRAFT_175156 [Ascobolus immersus RN42]|uniref:Uncharacterized protein n=1 Tax=Ascobolus immersus RN42 TaxID=1160509 RepID=A0A3N4HTF1_ASCIM|nr:hypothetical protein BJ508DRAFT_175156 [Ascobolus immersus RN42]
MTVSNLLNPKTEIRIRTSTDDDNSMNPSSYQQPSFDQRLTSAENVYKTLYFYHGKRDPYPYGLIDEYEDTFLSSIVRAFVFTYGVLQFIFRYILPGFLVVVGVCSIWAVIFLYGIYLPALDSVYDGAPASPLRNSYNKHLQPIVSTAKKTHMATSYPAMVRNLVMGTVVGVAFLIIILTHPIQQVGVWALDGWKATREKGWWAMTVVSLLSLWFMLQQVGKDLLWDKWYDAERCLTSFRDELSSKLL